MHLFNIIGNIPSTSVYVQDAYYKTLHRALLYDVSYYKNIHILLTVFFCLEASDDGTLERLSQQSVDTELEAAHYM